MTHRIPVIVWQTPTGTFTATTLDGPRASAVDVTSADALAQLKAYLVWLFRQHEGEPADLREPELRDYKIRVRPEYRTTNDSVFPVGETVQIHVTAVLGKRRDGSGVCIFPTLGHRFTYQPTDPLNELINDAVAQSLGRCTPQELVLRLAPPQISLSAIHLQDRRSRLKDEEFAPPILTRVADRLGQRNRWLRSPRGIGREALVRSLADRLTTGRASLLILGESGVGKSTVITEAALLLRRDLKRDSDAPPPVLWQTSARRLIAGMRYLGQWQERVEQVIAALADNAAVLCVENLLDLVRTGDEQPAASVAAFLIPYLERGELRLVAEVTPRELDACRRLLPGLADLFEVVRVPEFSPTETRTVLDQMLITGARQYHLEAEAGLAELIQRLFRRFVPYATFPGRVAQFTRRLLHERRSVGATHVKVADVLAQFRHDTGLPDVLLRDDIPLPQGEVLHHFQSQILGQPAACQAAAHVVTMLKTGLNDPRRPLGVLLFCGPTGVGKTEMAKALARYLFGDCDAHERLVRLDMSEYSGFGAAERLVSSSNGEVSEFIRKMRRHPFAVVLFDEIEKAAPEVHDALLGLLDEGRLTDRFGRTTNFQSAVVILTSNVGRDRATGVGFDSSAPASLEKIVLSEFRPEFVNRLDAIVPFVALDTDTIGRLAERELESVAKREGLAKMGLKLTWTADVVAHLARVGCDLRYGARPLQRAVERQVVSVVAEWRLEHPQVANSKIVLELRNGAVVVRPVFRST